MALGIPVVAALAAVFGLIPWFTTSYRITESQLQLRHGLLNRSTQTAPLDRVRSVDLEATVLHRILGMRKVQIGTGVDNERIELDAVTTERAEELRRLLLTQRSTPSTAPVEPSPSYDVSGDTPDGASTPTVPAVEPAEEPAEELARFQWSWVRFAPFNVARLAVVAAAIGFLGQFFNDFEISVDASDVERTRDSLMEVGIAALVVAIVLGAVVAWLLISIIGYVVQWFGLTLTRGQGSLHMSAGLLSTRSISVEEKRVRGIEIVEPLLMRPVKGAELATLATGVGEGGTTKILPQCPTPVAADVAGQVLGDHHPMRVLLTPHGPAARRRRHVAQQWVTLFLAAAGVAIHQVVLPLNETEAPLWWLLLPAAVWLPIAVVLAELSYAHLGHALSDDHLVAGHGVTARKRTVLEIDGIIGWAVQQNIFQRRLGLVTLVATTAAGDEHVTLTDVPEERAVRLAAQATRESVRPFLVR
ncbi:membrane protein [Nocardioides daphniae]|nr:membrane protein [Nocardioides daphniae]